MTGLGGCMVTFGYRNGAAFEAFARAHAKIIIAAEDMPWRTDLVEAAEELDEAAAGLCHVVDDDLLQTVSNR